MVPAYLADVFGTQFVGAIHGRLLTGWSALGIIGPIIVNYIRQFELEAGVPRNSVYDVIMYVLAAMVVGGIVCNYLGQIARRQTVYERRRGRDAAGTVTSRRRNEGINGHRQVTTQRHLDLGLARGRPSDRLGCLDHLVGSAGVFR
jgi:hypothetical protein